MLSAHSDEERTPCANVAQHCHRTDKNCLRQPAYATPRRRSVLLSCNARNQTTQSDPQKASGSPYRPGLFCGKMQSTSWRECPLDRGDLWTSLTSPCNTLRSRPISDASWSDTVRGGTIGWGFMFCRGQRERLKANPAASIGVAGLCSKCRWQLPELLVWTTLLGRGTG